MAARFDGELEAARGAYQQNDPFGALRRLDRARRVATKNRNEEQLRRVLDFADGVIARDERTEIERETVAYAAKQNLRQLERRRAYEETREPVDPYPDLETPRPQTRTYLSTGLKIWIGVGVALGTVFVVLWLLSPVLG
jgi:hypothetical protein